MTLYRKTMPVEAVPVSDLFDASKKQPDWVITAISRGTISSNGMGLVHIVTLRGSVIAQPADMLIRGVLDEVYPIARAVFDTSYEEVL